jgi:hypothetical protein
MMTEVGPPGKGTRQTVRVGLNDVFSVRRALGTQRNMLKKERQKLRRNPPEPIILVHYGPWHFFFAIFLEMVISSGR